MKQTAVNGINIVANSFSKLTKNEANEIVGGIFDPITSEGCGCCICKPNEASKGAGEYTATISGGGSK